MRNIKYFTFALLIPLCFNSCKKVIDFDPGEVSPYVVMISRPVNDSLVTVYLSQSVFFLESNDMYSQYRSISGASVQLFVNGTAYNGTYQSSDGNTGMFGHYQFNVRPKAGDSLYVEAVIPGQDEKVTASTRLPMMPKVEILDIWFDTSEYYDVKCRVKFKIKGGDAREFYSVSFFSGNQMYNVDSNTYYWDTTDAMRSHVYFNVNDPVVNTVDVSDIIDVDDGSFSGYTMHFTNDKFINGEHTFTAYMYMYSYSNYLIDYYSIPIWMSVSSMSEELYRYQQSVNDYSNADEFFSEPVQVLCNINGGIGIFGGRSQKTIRIQ